MTKYQLIFEMPEDREDHYSAINGAAFQAVLHSVMNQFIRNKLKYEEHPECCDKLLEELRDFITNELDGKEI